jgi:hypothetical protein
MSSATSAKIFIAKSNANKYGCELVESKDQEGIMQMTILDDSGDVLPNQNHKISCTVTYGPAHPNMWAKDRYPPKNTALADVSITCSMGDAPLAEVFADAFTKVLQLGVDKYKAANDLTGEHRATTFLSVSKKDKIQKLKFKMQGQKATPYRIYFAPTKVEIKAGSTMIDVTDKLNSRTACDILPKGTNLLATINLGRITRKEIPSANLTTYAPVQPTPIEIILSPSKIIAAPSKHVTEEESAALESTPEAIAALMARLNPLAAAPVSPPEEEKKEESVDDDLDAAAAAI